MLEYNINNQYFRIDDNIISSNNFSILKDSYTDLYNFLKDWFNSSTKIEVQTSGSTGNPQKLLVEKEKMVNSAIATCNFFNLNSSKTALLCMDLKYIGAKMMVVRALVAGMELVVKKADGHPFRNLNKEIDFAAIVPLQLYNSLKDKEINKIKTIIVGGGAVHNDLIEQLQNLSTEVYSTYGMTETLSHIALRKLNGIDKSSFYTPLDGIEISLNEDSQIQILAPNICDQLIVTNDIGKLESKGQFQIIGRKDNIVNSGGIKIQIEEIEDRIKPFISGNYAITSIKDAKLGEKLVLLVEEDYDEKELLEKLKIQLPKYQNPQRIFRINQIPHTKNGKIARFKCKELAESIEKD